MRILIIGLWGIGNILMSTPAVRILRKALPNSRIDYLVRNEKYACLLDKNPDIDFVITLKSLGLDFLLLGLFLLGFKYDVCITMSPSNKLSLNILAWLTRARIRITSDYPIGFWRTLRFLQNARIPAMKVIHDVEQNANLIGWFGIKKLPKKYVLNFEENDWVNKKFGRGKWIGIHPGADKKHPQRKWPDYKFNELAQLIREKTKYKMIFLLGPDDYFEFDEENWVNSVIIKNRDLNTVAHIISKCSAFVGNDSGLCHIAAALGIPTIVIFGPADSRRTGPYGGSIIRKKMECAPCLIYPYKSVKSKITCRNIRCLDELPSYTVFEKLKKIIKKNAKI